MEDRGVKIAATVGVLAVLAGFIVFNWSLKQNRPAFAAGVCVESKLEMERWQNRQMFRIEIIGNKGYFVRKVNDDTLGYNLLFKDQRDFREVKCPERVQPKVEEKKSE